MMTIEPQDPPPRPNLETPTRQWLRFAEYHATALRRRVGLGPQEPFDPRDLARALHVRIAHPAEVVGLAPEDLQNLSSIDAKVWSGGGIRLPEDRFLVLLHPNQTSERAAVTVMEEIAHDYHDHQPSQLVTDVNGFTTRQFDEQSEKEAYWTAAATLLPRFAVAKAVWQGRSAQDLAHGRGVSKELVEFRIKTLRLWEEHRNPPPGRRQAG